MANKPMKSIKLPGLPDTYTFIQDDTTLTVSGAAADAKVVGDTLSAQSDDIAALEGLGFTVVSGAVNQTYNEEE